jgi:hypothetical protein
MLDWVQRNRVEGKDLYWEVGAKRIWVFPYLDEDPSTGAAPVFDTSPSSLVWDGKTWAKTTTKRVCLRHTDLTVSIIKEGLQRFKEVFKEFPTGMILSLTSGGQGGALLGGPETINEEGDDLQDKLRNLLSKPKRRPRVENRAVGVQECPPDFQVEIFTDHPLRGTEDFFQNRSKKGIETFVKTIKAEGRVGKLKSWKAYEKPVPPIKTISLTGYPASNVDLGWLQMKIKRYWEEHKDIQIPELCRQIENELIWGEVVARTKSVQATSSTVIPLQEEPRCTLKIKLLTKSDLGWYEYRFSVLLVGVKRNLLIEEPQDWGPHEGPLSVDLMSNPVEEKKDGQ